MVQNSWKYETENKTERNLIFERTFSGRVRGDNLLLYFLICIPGAWVILSLFFPHWDNYISSSLIW